MSCHSFSIYSLYLFLHLVFLVLINIFWPFWYVTNLLKSLTKVFIESQHFLPSFNSLMQFLNLLVFKRNIPFKLNDQTLMITGFNWRYRNLSLSVSSFCQCVEMVLICLPKMFFVLVDQFLQLCNLLIINILLYLLFLVHQINLSVQTFHGLSQQLDLLV